MQFEWNDRKNATNIGKHGFDFADTYRIFDLPLLIDLDERDDYGEDRRVGIGLLDGRVVVVIFTEPAANTIRVISLRKALSHERKRYEQYIQDRLGQN
ncbi:BrnT family toxin [Nodosilinea sp. P-1105]|uniref:BrnT family toxin n=1 Tax=Nodosilinea sp. P-1105 TaxID=2546229 RepID=UPI00146AB4F1|nr:BrnT family toxin [Nodosilinea sp. P-1105]NMF83315.1 BrnT family toxin [Nodosilinea sp. P-1105]